MLPRVAIVASPGLLRETLAQAVRRDGLDVACYDDVGAVAAGLCDVMLLCGLGVRGGSAPPVVVRLPDAGEGLLGSVTTAEGCRSLRLGDLARVVATVHDLADG